MIQIYHDIPCAHCDAQTTVGIYDGAALCAACLDRVEPARRLSPEEQQAQGDELLSSLDRLAAAEGWASHASEEDPMTCTSAPIATTAAYTEATAQMYFRAYEAAIDPLNAAAEAYDETYVAALAAGDGPDEADALAAEVADWAYEAAYETAERAYAEAIRAQKATQTTVEAAAKISA